MAFALKGAGSASTANSTTANQSTLVVTTATTAGAAGDLAVLLYAVDNNQTTDGDEGAVTGVVDSAGNKWVKAVEFTNGQGTAQTGATCGIWYSNLRVALPIAGTVTLSFSNNTSRDASAASLRYYTKAAGFDAVIQATGTLANDAAAAGSLDVTTLGFPQECLRVRGIASESNVVTALTPSVGFNIVTQSVAVIAAATSMGIRGEYLITTASTAASAPTAGAGAVDNASVYVAFKETLTAWFDNNSRDVGAQVAVATRNAVAATLIAASAGLFMPPQPPVTAPKGWQQALSTAPPVAQPVHTQPQLVSPPETAAPAAATEIGVPLHMGGAPPRIRRVYYQARVEVPYVTPAAVVQVPSGWWTGLSVAPPVNKARQGGVTLPFNAPAAITVDEWMQPLSVAPAVAKPQPGFGFVPFDTAQRSVNFTPFGWHGPFANAPAVAKAQPGFVALPYAQSAPVTIDEWLQPLSAPAPTANAQPGFAFVPFDTAQLSVNFTPFGWHLPLSAAPVRPTAQLGLVAVPYNQIAVVTADEWLQPLSVVPPLRRAIDTPYQLPVYTVVATDNTVTIDKWQQPLSVAPPVNKAQAGSGFVPFNTAQLVSGVYTDWYLQPLSIAAPVNKAQPGFSFVPLDTRQVASSTTLEWQQPLSIPQKVSRATFVDMPYLAAITAAVTADQWLQPLSSAPLVARARPGYSFVPFDTAQLSVNFTNFGWQGPLAAAVKPVKPASDQPTFVNVSQSVPQGWHQALSTPPLVAKVAYNNQPLASPPTATSNINWQQPLSFVPSRTTAQLGSVVQPAYVAPVTVAGIAGMAWFTPLSIPVKMHAIPRQSDILSITRYDTVAPVGTLPHSKPFFATPGRLMNI